MKYEDKPWLKSYEKGVPEFINFKNVCLPDILEETVRMFPDNTALIFQGTRVNFRQFKNMVDRFATCLDAFGVKKGDAVALLLPNIIPCVVAYYAILKLGAIAVMNNPLYSDTELEHQFNDSESKVLITLDALGNRTADSAYDPSNTLDKTLSWVSERERVEKSCARRAPLSAGASEFRIYFGRDSTRFSAWDRGL